MEGNDTGQAIFSAFGIAVLALVVLAGAPRRGLTRVSLLLALPATVLLLIQAASEHDYLLPYSSALEAALYLYAAYALVKYMLADHEITTDELFAVGATFTLVAWAFAYSSPCSGGRAGELRAAVDPACRPQLDGTALPELHHAHQHGPQRRGARQGFRAQRRDDRAARRARVRGPRRVAARGLDGARPRRAAPVRLALPWPRSSTTPSRSSSCCSWWRRSRSATRATTLTTSSATRRRHAHEPAARHGQRDHQRRLEARGACDLRRASTSSARCGSTRATGGSGCCSSSPTTSPTTGSTASATRAASSGPATWCTTRARTTTSRPRSGRPGCR